MTNLFYTFPLYRDGDTRRLIDFEERGQLDELDSAIAGEIRAHAASAPPRTDRGLVTRDEARTHHKTLEAIAVDLQTKAQRAGQWREWLTGNRLEAPAPIGAMLAGHPDPKPWADKVAALRSIIGARCASLDDDVAKGRVTADQASARIEALEALHALYWCDGFAFDGTDDQLRAHSNKLWEAALNEKAPATVGEDGPGDKKVTA